MLTYTDGLYSYQIPPEMVEGLELYINHHVRQGSFLHAVLCNDLIEACKCADKRNMACLPAYANFLYNYAPAACFGSREKVSAWLRMTTQI